ncbi:MAG: SpoIIE family protein phosphatase, partial [Treponema sp.]|nr:SpoIIE family protein phosphatase [Treponema sp.]
MHSIRTKILTIALVFLALFGTAFVLYSFITTRNYKRLRLDGIEKTVELETAKINKIIAEIEQGAVQVATGGLLFHKSRSKEVGETFLLEYLRGFPAAIGCGFWFESYAYDKSIFRTGINVFFDKTKNKVCLDDSYDIAYYDYHNQPWYREIIDGLNSPYQVVWTRPYFDDTTYSLMTTAGAGIFNDLGHLIGISTIDWEIDEVIKELSAIKPTPNSFVMLCSPVQNYIISNTYSHASAGASLYSIPWKLGASSFVMDGVKYLSYNRVMDNNWLLFVQIPEHEIFAEVEKQNNRFSVIIAVSSLLMLCIAYLLISKMINKPIKRLTSDVAKLALGNLDVRIEVSSKDELGLLAETFNKMTRDLKESINAYSIEHAEKERIAAELGVAAEIQAGMLPCVFPPFPERSEFDLYAAMLPAKEVGGDFYDFYFVDKKTLALVIADVSGKGVPAAWFMVIAKILIKNNVSSNKSPGEVFRAVNNILCDNNDAGMFATAFMGYYNLETGGFTYVNAGHNPPLVKKSGSTYEFIRTKPGLVLGCTRDAVYNEEEITLGRGDVIFLFTDGVTEAMNSGKVLFSEERLHEALN